MMNAKVNCPECWHSIYVKPSQVEAGKEITCQSCGKTFQLTIYEALAITRDLREQLRARNEEEH